MKKFDLAALKKAYAPTTEETNRESNYYPFWNMKTGERCVIRFLPDKNENNPRGFTVEKVFHNLTINGEKKMVPCLSMYGEECPICKLSQEFYKTEGKDSPNGKKYWRKKQYLAQALIVEDPLPPNKDTGETHEGQVRLLAINYQIYRIIQDAFGSDELEAVPFDYDEGYDFIIKKTEQGDYASYVVGTKFGRQRALTKQELAVVEENLIDLSTLLPKNPGVEKIQALLNADLNGTPVDEDDGEHSSESVVVKPTKQETNNVSLQQPSSKPPVKQTSKVVEEAEETDDDIDAMLATIRARRAAKN